MYQSFAALQKHLDVSKHIIKPERESVYVEIKRKWADTCITVSGSYIHAEPSTSSAENTRASIPETQEEVGWALRKTINLWSSLKRQKTIYVASSLKEKKPVKRLMAHK